MSRQERQPRRERELIPRSAEDLREAAEVLRSRAVRDRLAERHTGATPEWFDNLDPAEKKRIARLIQSAINLGQQRGVDYARGENNIVTELVEQNRRNSSEEKAS